ncbi:hypothetical protein CGZ93_10775 [Enemella dayhoffiae]|uniref:Uncharacterized protein n=1 Tax=Enemella dayhoffiae TaxID=2016507 RepID=A0A255H0M0_9ACTN|nr:hypothetical protein [Enemella dayhoffiae]OYO21241.1 hypothetical protein CGZ93_10775 [Enemella dayhoffiae]
MSPQVDPLVDKGVPLFTYLAKTQQLREKAVTEVKSYERDGEVVWLHDLPQGEEIRLASEGTELLSIERPERVDAPREVARSVSTGASL